MLGKDKGEGTGVGEIDEECFRLCGQVQNGLKSLRFRPQLQVWSIETAPMAGQFDRISAERRDPANYEHFIPALDSTLLKYKLFQSASESALIKGRIERIGWQDSTWSIWREATNPFAGNPWEDDALGNAA